MNDKRPLAVHSSRSGLRSLPTADGPGQLKTANCQLLLERDIVVSQVGDRFPHRPVIAAARGHARTRSDPPLSPRAAHPPAAAPAAREDHALAADLGGALVLAVLCL